MKNPARQVPMPAGVRLYNACSEPCDAAEGACACGAWHNLEETVERLGAELRRVRVTGLVQP